MEQTGEMPTTHVSSLHPRDRFPRIYCTCAKCQATCRVMPGLCIPGDLDRIARAAAPLDLWSGEDAEGCKNWTANHFLASAETDNVPSIVMAARKDGSCVFFNHESERCVIHESAPFGCSHLDPHLNYREAALRMAVAYDWIRRSVGNPTNNTYAQIWAWLCSVDATTDTAAKRRVALCEELARVAMEKRA